MLAPNSRMLLLDALRPPAGFEVDAAIATTFTLSLDALLIAPAAWALHAARDRLEAVDPILLANSLRLFADRTIVFHQAGAANPLGQGNEELAAFLDEMVIPIRVGRGETFHPKVWVLRFRSQAGEVGLRVLIGSRNLSFDSTWDVLVSMDSGPPGRGTAPGTALADLLRSLPGRSTVKVSEERQKLLDSVASDIARAHFVAPDGCSAAEILWSTRSRPVMPFPSACNRRLVISPFLGESLLDGLPMPSDPDASVLVSRSASLTREIAANFSAYTMATDLGGVADGSEARLGEELHAKVFAFDGDDDSMVILGSANATGAAFTMNDEVVVKLSGPTATIGVEALLGEPAGDGVDERDDLELVDLLERWFPGDDADADEEAGDGRFYDEAVRLVASTSISGECAEVADDRWEMSLELDAPVVLPAGVGVDFRLLSQAESFSAGLLDGERVRVSASLAEVTRFVVARFSDLAGACEAIQVVLVADIAMPAGRQRRALRALLTNREKFARFLRYLLESADGAVLGDGLGDVVAGVPRRSRSARGLLEDGPILEQLLRLLAVRPDELRHLDAVIKDFGEDASILPDGFAELWSAIAPLIPGETT